MRDFTVLIVTNCNSDLSMLKFEDFEIMNIFSDEFKEFTKDTLTRENEFLDEISETYQYNKQERYAIVRKDRTQKFSPSIIYEVYNFILLLFPSIFSVEFILDYQIIQDTPRFISAFKCDIKTFNRDEFLEFNTTNISDINSFIEKHIKTYKQKSYIKISSQNYINAFESDHCHFSFIAFCISLECITNGNTELLYRICRNVAVLCGKDIESGTIIFNNVKKIYSLRSKVVHGDDFSDDSVSDNLYYLEALTSKVIVELIIHNIRDLNSLNEIITSLGFGDRKKISENWHDFIYNEKIENLIFKRL